MVVKLLILKRSELVSLAVSSLTMARTFIWNGKLSCFCDGFDDGSSGRQKLEGFTWQIFIEVEGGSKKRSNKVEGEKEELKR